MKVLIDRFLRIAVALLAVSLGSGAGTAAAEEGASSTQPGKQEITTVKTLNLRGDQWSNEAGSELKVCPGRFRSIDGEIRCRVPDGGLNGLLGGMVTGESMTAQDAIKKMAGDTAKVLDITQNGDQNRLQIKFSYQATGGRVASLTDFSSIATRNPTEADELAKSTLGWFFGVGFGIVVLFIFRMVVLDPDKLRSPTVSESSDTFAQLRDEQASQRPTVRVDTPPPLVLEPSAQPMPSATVMPSSTLLPPDPTPASGRRLFLD
ncbi:hypothetical protein KW849_14235 [Pseudomonas sp. PDM26]|uniref:hypothetical protein n=1 Tax=Pseudomonas sp. PDM26 TaxID=2854766 RepID=UPI001C45518B|nr:hypothetical protein [Pseudomonas sp. PDM26]MBV7547446.1 hypothetical protein [Pseudomonas sp. PDM26]